MVQSVKPLQQWKEQLLWDYWDELELQCDGHGSCSLLGDIL